MQDKLVKAFQAKTMAGKANYLVDALAEEGLRNCDLDFVLHGLVDLGLTERTAAERVERWMKKSARYAGLFE
jgi:hypothetical protein